MIETWSEAIDAFNEFLDSLFEESYGDVSLGYGYGAVKITSASRWLREVDPTAYRSSLHEWADAEGIDTDELQGEDRLP